MLTSAARARLFAIFIPIATIALCLGITEIGLRLAIFNDSREVVVSPLMKHALRHVVASAVATECFFDT